MGRNAYFGESDIFVVDSVEKDSFLLYAIFLFEGHELIASLSRIEEILLDLLVEAEFDNCFVTKHHVFLRHFGTPFSISYRITN
jgi:hypothetical protein